MNVTRTPAGSDDSGAEAVALVTGEETPPDAPDPEDGFGSAVIAAAGAEGPAVDRDGSSATAARCAGTGIRLPSPRPSFERPGLAGDERPGSLAMKHLHVCAATSFRVEHPRAAMLRHAIVTAERASANDGAPRQSRTASAVRITPDVLLSVL